MVDSTKKTVTEQIDATNSTALEMFKLPRNGWKFHTSSSKTSNVGFKFSCQPYRKPRAQMTRSTVAVSANLGYNNEA